MISSLAEEPGVVDAEGLRECERRLEDRPEDELPPPPPAGADHHNFVIDAIGGGAQRGRGQAGRGRGDQREGDASTDSIADRCRPAMDDFHAPGSAVRMDAHGLQAGVGDALTSHS